MHQHVFASALVAVALAMTAPAQAEVTFNPGTGTGYVGKQAIKQMFGREAVTFEGAENVSFSVRTVRRYSTLCKLKDSSPAVTETYERKRTHTTEVLSDVRGNPRRNVVRGFDLTGYGEEKIRGRYCPKGWKPIETPALLNVSPSVLRATYAEDTRQLWAE